MDKTIQQIPFLRLTAALIAGIILGDLFDFSLFYLAVSIFLIAVFLVWLNYHYNFKRIVLFGIGVHLLVAGIGIWTIENYNKKPVFYSHGKFSATVLEILQEKPNSYQSVLRIKAVFRNDSVFKTDEKIMVYFAKSEESQILQPGQNIIFTQSPQFIKNSNNPFEFDYAAYLIRKKIYRQVFLPHDRWMQFGFKPAFSLTILAERARIQLLNIYRNQNMGEKEFNVLSALTLGYKRGLDPDTKKVFASAGAMHVLAVSGLHVGIVFIVLSFLFGFLKKYESGRILFVILIVSALWCFAFVTGLSPSVRRAASMFTIVVAGQSLKRPPNIYNSLAVSAFLLLLVNPNNLFEAGFQLSYSAVFGIVFMQPKLQKIFTFRFLFFRYIWTLFTVSVAAQIATFPISVFYFNQFPVYFWLSNLVVIPAATLLIPLGMALLAFNWIPAVTSVFSFLIQYILAFVIQFLTFIEQIPFSVLEFNVFSLELIFIYGILFSLFLFIEFRSSRYFKGFLFFVLVLTAVSFSIQTLMLYRNEVIVYNFPNQVVIHLISGKRNYIVSEGELPETGHEIESVKNTIRNMRLKTPVYIRCDNFYSDPFISVKNGIVNFNGRIIACRTGLNQISEEIIPEIAINPPSVNFEKENLPFQVIFSKSGFGDQINPENEQVYYLSEKGAFRKKW